MIAYSIYIFFTKKHKWISVKRTLRVEIFENFVSNISKALKISWMFFFQQLRDLCWFMRKLKHGKFRCTRGMEEFLINMKKQIEYFCSRRFNNKKSPSEKSGYIFLAILCLSNPPEEMIEFCKTRKILLV